MEFDQYTGNKNIRKMDFQVNKDFWYYLKQVKSHIPNFNYKTDPVPIGILATFNSRQNLEKIKAAKKEIKWLMRNYSRKDYSHNWGPPANKYKSKSKSKKNEENRYRVVLN